MWNQLEIRQRYEQRIQVCMLALVCLLLLLFGRMVQLQWVQYQQHFTQAEDNRIHVSPILPTRGVMFDRHGLGLAVNKISYQVTFIPERSSDVQASLQALQALMSWSDYKLKQMVKRISQARSDRAVLLMDKLPWSVVAPLASRLHHFAGVDVVASTHRSYPYAALTSHMVGYLSLVRQEDIQKGYLRTEYVGRSGLERILEARLHGKLGYKHEEVNAKGRRVAVLKTVQPNMGESIHLSVDVKIQAVAAAALGERTGAVVVMDVHTGEVLTLLSQPGYDSNKFITGLETEQWNTWLNDEERPLLNRTTQAAYPPASTMKMVTSFAGLAHGLSLASGSTQCPGYIELADRKIRCWKKRGHGKVDLHDALVHSCDVYFYEMGDALGMKRLTAEANRWGFGEKTGINLPPEARGILPADKPKSGRKRWYRGETMITAIGQGAVTVTPLQMVRFAAAIANGGKILTPLLEKGEAVQVQRQVDVQAQHLMQVRQGMRDVVAKRTGTAHRALAAAAWTVAGKTGTAQVVKMSEDESRSFSDAKKHQDHAWFMGYAPYDNPQVAIAVFVEHGGHGGSDAAPVARRIVDALAAQEKLP
ncbi:MAG: penicillin-binding protein 2 [Mariprofundaceae bacterium]|nr:penicillin-binding protein 2 [Mariprofundaceae bacterium]